MSSIVIFNQKGEKTGTRTLNKEIFQSKISKPLMHLMYLRQMANSRKSLASVKDRSAVRGGGAKPFRQKGTGRARQGTRSAPQMKGGGVVFGPSTAKNFSINMNKKQRRLGLLSTLTSRMKDKAFLGLEKYEGKISTKDCALLISKLPIKRSVLFILDKKNEALEKSLQNLPNVKSILFSYINVVDLLKYKSICLVADADKKIEETFL